jgi:hypothetical protein
MNIGMGEIMRCNQCGTELLENAKFCAGCGSPAGTSPTPLGAPPTGAVPLSVSSPTSPQQPAIQSAPPPMSAYPAPTAQPQAPWQLPSSQAWSAPAYVPPPTTGYGQQTPPLQSKKPKKAVKIVAIVAGVLLLSCIGMAVFAALINGDSAGQSTGNDSRNNSQSADVKRIGESVTVGGFEITVESFEVRESANDAWGTGYYVAEEGYELVAVDIKVKNLTDSEKTFDPITGEIVTYSNGGKMEVRTVNFSFTIRQGSSVFRRLTNAGGTSNLSNTTFDPQDSKEGFMVFSVPEGSLDSGSPLIFRIERDEVVFDYNVEMGTN